jgi:hypothetical protein
MKKNKKGNAAKKANKNNGNKMNVKETLDKIKTAMQNAADKNEIIPADDNVEIISQASPAENSNTNETNSDNNSGSENIDNAESKNRNYTDVYEFEFNIVATSTRKTLRSITIFSHGASEAEALQNAADEAHKQIAEGDEYLSYTQKFSKKSNINL